ncbi:MAG: STAS domain-containing protein, partial [Spirochaetes bacterium]|nr:STAS domain-containing protein [Spirochaetota bacterium]
MEQPEDKKIRIGIEHLEENPQINLIELVGYVDSYNSKFFQETIIGYINNGDTKLIMDCQGLNYLSSAGIGSFVAISEELKGRGFIVLYNVPPTVLD